MDATRPRLSVFRSLNHIYGQIINDVTGTTLVSGSSLVASQRAGTKTEVARTIGKELAVAALAKG
ncbi:MAG TPA: 50S ribosomal protein L18, partial [Candidatus Babeliales bacterium]|nr:50S ribosomal protein L18 [Candidatus Babeliales bacterium]